MSTPTAHAESLLAELGAANKPHPGGTLLAHLRRVRSRLAVRNARAEPAGPGRLPDP